MARKSFSKLGSCAGRGSEKPGVISRFRVDDAAAGGCGAGFWAHDMFPDRLFRGQLWAAPAQAGAGGVDTPVLHRVARRADGAAVLVGTQRTRERAFAGAAFVKRDDRFDLPAIQKLVESGKVVGGVPGEGNKAYGLRTGRPGRAHCRGVGRCPGAKTRGGRGSVRR